MIGGIIGDLIGTLEGLIGRTDVDVVSLEGFLETLQMRRLGILSVIHSLERHSDRPDLGTFEDAAVLSAKYDQLRTTHLARANRLLTAVDAAISGTQSIITNYHTTEQRNHANVADIDARLSAPATSAATSGEGFA